MIQKERRSCPVCKGQTTGKLLRCPECASKGYLEVSVDTETYDADYFLRGQESGKSLYSDYRWMPELTKPMVCSIISHLGIEHSSTILDFGCARGYVVRALRELGYTAYGYDVSRWAIDNCDRTVKQYLTCDDDSGVGSFDWIIAKDVLEHIPEVQKKIDQLVVSAQKGIFAVVPLSEVDGGRYVIKSYEKDVTHVHRLTLPTWAAMFLRTGWEVAYGYRVRGVKDNYWQDGMYMGNGFITARRLNL